MTKKELALQTLLLKTKKQKSKTQMGIDGDTDEQMLSFYLWTKNRMNGYVKACMIVDVYNYGREKLLGLKDRKCKRK